MEEKLAQAMMEAMDKASKPETKVNIIQQGGFILIQFTEPVQNLKISKEQAREMARHLVKECL